MTQTNILLLVFTVTAVCAAAGYSIGFAVSRQAAEALILAAEREGRAQGQLDGYNGGYGAGWRAAHRVALQELRTGPTSRGGKRIVKALAAGSSHAHGSEGLVGSIGGAQASDGAA